MISVKEIRDSFFHLLFPHTCCGCGSDLLNEESNLCLRCLYAMPGTGFEKHLENPVGKIFWGRLPLVNASAQYYFTKESLMQQLLHQFKYRHQKDLGLQLGSMMGHQFLRSGLFDVDAMVPLPLFPAKEKIRGFNQATVLCRGIASQLHIPVLENIIIRPQETLTQTRKGRIERWKNMDGKFVLCNPDAVSGRHILIVDDVITTGATLEACGYELLKAPGTSLSVAALCFTSR